MIKRPDRSERRAHARPAARRIWEHLDELRSRLVKAMSAYLVGAALAWTYRDALLAWLWMPFAEAWRAQEIAGDPTLNFSAPGDAFKAYFKLSLVGGLLFSAPMWFYQLWSFIEPALRKGEKKLVVPFVLSSTLLFVGGGLFGWRFGFPVTFGYFLGLASTAKDAGLTVRPVVMIGAYLDFVSQMLLAFGLIFELPVVILFLSLAGVINYLHLIRFARWFVLVAFTVGAILTPPEMASQLMMSLPLCALYGVSIGLAYMFGQRPSADALAQHRAQRAARRAPRT